MDSGGARAAAASAWEYGRKGRKTSASSPPSLRTSVTTTFAAARTPQPGFAALSLGRSAAFLRSVHSGQWCSDLAFGLRASRLAFHALCQVRKKLEIVLEPSLYIRTGMRTARGGTRQGYSGQAVFCRRDIARVVMALRVVFSGQDHPAGREIDRMSETAVKRVARLVNAGRSDGSIPPGPPTRAVAIAFMGALEGTMIAVAGQAPHDEVLVARAVAGVVGL
jgi:hypothetical protein